MENVIQMPERNGSLSAEMFRPSVGQGRLLHYVETAKRFECQAVFTIRSGMISPDMGPKVTFNRAKIEGSRGQLGVSWSSYQALLREAEKLCGGQRVSATVRPDWLPEGVSAMTISWTGDVLGTSNDTFRLTIDLDATVVDLRPS